MMKMKKNKCVCVLTSMLNRGVNFLRVKLEIAYWDLFIVNVNVNVNVIGVLVVSSSSRMDTHTHKNIMIYFAFSSPEVLKFQPPLFPMEIKTPFNNLHTNKFAY